jgi:hypothetical protein
VTRNAYSIVTRTVDTGRPVLFGSSATLEAAQKRAAQWSKRKGLGGHPDYVWPLEAVSRAEYERRVAAYPGIQ